VVFCETMLDLYDKGNVEIFELYLERKESLNPLIPPKGFRELGFVSSHVNVGFILNVNVVSSFTLEPY